MRLYRLLAHGVRIGMVLFILTGATLLTFSYVVLSDPANLDGMYDVYRYFGPITFIVDFAIHSGEFPLWNPITYCGMPITGNPQSFLFYVPHLLRALLTNPPTPERSTFTLAILWGIHLVFMAFGTYLFARSHRLSHGGALMAGITFAFSALMVRRMGEYHFITTMAWLPFLLLVIKKMIDYNDFFTKMGLALLGGILLGMSFMGGYLQIANLMGFTPALYALFYFFVSSPWSSHHSSACYGLRVWIYNGIAMGVIYSVGAGLAAVTLIPAWEMSAFSLRSAGVSLGKFSDLWKWTPLEFYQKMVLYGGVKYEAETIRNAGIAALVLALAAFSHKSRKEVFLFAALYAILFECCFGPPLPIGTLLEKVTPFTLSAYSRAYDFALLPLALLAGMGLDALTQPMEKVGRRLARALVLLLAAWVCLAPVGLWMEEISYIKVTNTIRILPAITIGVMVLGSLFRLNPWGRALFASVVIVLVFGETLAWNHSFVPFLTRKKITDVCNVKQEGHAISLANYRETDPICNRFQYSVRFAMNGVDPAHLAEVRNLLSGPPREGGGLRGVQDWEPTRANMRGNLLFKRSFWLARNYVLGTLPPKKVVFPSATTVFLEHAPDAPIQRLEISQVPRRSISKIAAETTITAPPTLFVPIPSGQKKDLYFDAQLPRALADRPEGSAGAVHSALYYRVKSEATAQVDVTFTQPGTDRSEFGFLHTIQPTGGREIECEVPMPDLAMVRVQLRIENKGPGAFEFTGFTIRSDANDEDGYIRITSRTMNTVDVTVGPLPDWRILTFLDAYYQGWHALVNGKEVPILRANEQFKAVLLPAGTHHVRFEFRPKTTYYALALSLGTLAFALLGLLVCWRCRMPGVSSEPAEQFSLLVRYDNHRNTSTTTFLPSDSDG